MQKKLYFLGIFLLVFVISYLFYNSCKRDTLVTTPPKLVTIPDSCWLYGNFNLEELRNDIAWTSITNTDFRLLFQTDTSTNTLLNILKSPSSYSITNQKNIHYFSFWKNHFSYTGLLFSIENKNQLVELFKGNVFISDKITHHSFRSREGYWLYNDNQLLFICKQHNDSIIAHSIFNQNQHTLKVPELNDSLYATCFINTLNIEDSTLHPLLDSAHIQLSLKKTDALIHIDWTYSGLASDFFNQTQLSHPNTNDGLYTTFNPSTVGLEKVIEICQKSNILKQSQLTTIQPFLSILQHTTTSLQFNGWKKIKNSFFISVLNDEFEMVLVKKDSSYMEPSFRVVLNKQDKKNVVSFLSYLHKEGLISKNNKSPFKITLGNFDSELFVLPDYTFVYQNKHAGTVEPMGMSQNAAWIFYLKPALIEGLYSQKEYRIENKYKLIDKISIVGFKETNTLYGTLKIKFMSDKHSILSFIELLKKQK